MTDRPVTYQDWRDLWQRELYSFGYGWFTSLGLRAVSPDIFRALRRPQRLWRQYHRLRRIQKRLDAERDAMSTGYLDAIVRMCRPDLEQKHD